MGYYGFFVLQSIVVSNHSGIRTNMKLNCFCEYAR